MTTLLAENPANPAAAVNRMFGEASISVAGSADVVLDDVEAQYGSLVFTGALTGNISVIVPADNRPWDIFNATSGAHTLTVKKAGGTGVAVTQGKRVRLRYSAHVGDVVAYGPEI